MRMRLKNVVLNKYETDDEGYDVNYKVMGNIYGCPHFEEGKLIITTFVEKIDFETKTIETETTEYDFDGFIYGINEVKKLRE